MKIKEKKLFKNVFVIGIFLSACEDNKYDSGCRHDCGNCLNGSVCDKVNGSCPDNLCEPGWQGDTCNNSCEDNKYGHGCSHACGNCLNGSVCDKVIGSCPDNLCEPGWEGDTCNNPCKDGNYGNACINVCGNCLNGSVCDKVKGSCPGGLCEPSWEGDTCNEKLSKQHQEPICMPTSKAGFIVGGVATPIVVIVAAIVLFFILRRRKLQKYSEMEGNYERPATINTTYENPYTDAAIQGEENQNNHVYATLELEAVPETRRTSLQRNEAIKQDGGETKKNNHYEATEYINTNLDALEKQLLPTNRINLCHLKNYIQTKSMTEFEKELKEQYKFLHEL